MGSRSCSRSTTGSPYPWRNAASRVPLTPRSAVRSTTYDFITLAAGPGPRPSTSSPSPSTAGHSASLDWPSARSSTAAHRPSGSAMASGGRGATRSADGTPPVPTGVSHECSDDGTMVMALGSHSITLSLLSRTAMSSASLWFLGAPDSLRMTAMDPTVPLRSNSATTSRDTCVSSSSSSSSSPPSVFLFFLASATALALSAASPDGSAEGSRRIANTVRWFACITTRFGGPPSPMGWVKYAATAWSTPVGGWTCLWIAKLIATGGCPLPGAVPPSRPIN